MHLPLAQSAADDGQAGGVDVNHRTILIMGLPGAARRRSH
jgi:hypothetical protein